jgi:hypothetical protein
MSGDPREVKEAVLKLAPAPDEMVGVLVAERRAPPLEALAAALAETDHSFFGGLFPAIVDGRDKYDSGVLAFTVPKLGEPVVVTRLDTDAFTIPDCVSRVQEHRGGKPTALVLVDGMVSTISRFIEGLYHQLGGAVSYWGGGAGTQSHVRRPCTFTRQGVYQDAAVIALAARPARLGVSHGWQELRGPLVATRARGNVVAELNWKNALAVYRGVVERDAQVNITPENLYEVARTYPFGIRKHDQEVVVRCLAAVGENDSLVCVGDVPENTVLAILKAHPDRLIEAAGRATRNALPADPRTVTHCLLADGVSRVTLLGTRFPEEMAAVADALGPVALSCPPIGMLSLGQIASNGEGYLEYLNKTCVVATLAAA